MAGDWFKVVILHHFEADDLSFFCDDQRHLQDISQVQFRLRSWKGLHFILLLWVNGFVCLRNLQAWSPFFSNRWRQDSRTSQIPSLSSRLLESLHSRSLHSTIAQVPHPPKALVRSGVRIRWGAGGGSFLVDPGKFLSPSVWLDWTTVTRRRKCADWLRVAPHGPQAVPQRTGILSRQTTNPWKAITVVKNLVCEAAGVVFGSSSRPVPNGSTLACYPSKR